MLATVVITIFGADRPGLVEALSSRVSAAGGNWLESRLLHLGGHFAGIVRLEVEAARHDALLAALRHPAIPGLTIAVHHPVASPATSAPEVAGERVTLEVVGHDRPGIVREISRALAAHGVNVEELATERTNAPMTGEPIFQARAKITLPSGGDAAALRRDLEKIATDLMVDLELRPTN